MPKVEGYRVPLEARISQLEQLLEEERYKIACIDSCLDGAEYHPEYRGWTPVAEKAWKLKGEVERLNECCRIADKDKEVQADVIMHDAEKIKKLEKRVDIAEQKAKAILADLTAGDE